MFYIEHLLCGRHGAQGSINKECDKNGVPASKNLRAREEDRHSGSSHTERMINGDQFNDGREPVATSKTPEEGSAEHGCVRRAPMRESRIKATRWQNQAEAICLLSELRGFLAFQIFSSLLAPSSPSLNMRRSPLEKLSIETMTLAVLLFSPSSPAFLRGAGGGGGHLLTPTRSAHMLVHRRARLRSPRPSRPGVCSHSFSETVPKGRQ